MQIGRWSARLTRTGGFRSLDMETINHQKDDISEDQLLAPTEFNLPLRCEHVVGRASKQGSCCRRRTVPCKLVGHRNDRTGRIPQHSIGITLPGHDVNKILVGTTGLDIFIRHNLSCVSRSGCSNGVTPEQSAMSDSSSLYGLNGFPGNADRTNTVLLVASGKRSPLGSRNALHVRGRQALNSNDGTSTSRQKDTRIGQPLDDLVTGVSDLTERRSGGVLIATSPTST